MTRSFLGLFALASVALFSCTAILGGVPTSGGSGGAASAGGASTTSTTGAPGAGGNGSGAGGSTSSANGGNGGGPAGSGASTSGAGGAPTCATKSEMCGSNRKCCTGLVCGSAQTCVAMSASSSSGGPNCATCDAALSNPMMMSVLCSASKAKYDALKQCACNQCPQQCSEACSSGLITSACQSCAGMACQKYLTACVGDSGCNTCSEMLLVDDIALQDTCAGAASTIFQNWFNCVCGPSQTCDSCSTYCTSGVLDMACEACETGVTSHCTQDYDMCESN